MRAYRSARALIRRAAGTTPASSNANLEVRSKTHLRSTTMRINLVHVTPLFGAAAVAAAIAVAPIASAAPGPQAPAQPQRSCTGSGVGTICQSPGNVQINDAPPPAQFYPYGGEAF